MLNQLKTCIVKHQLIEDSDRLLLAVSGGKDSVAMAHLFRQLNYPFALAHCNFKLRAEDSDGDEEFVKTLAQILGVPFYFKHFDTTGYAKQNGLSIQMAARDLRYQWFKNLAQDQAFDKIVTAHHQDDAIETLLIKKSRKASLSALQGIPIQNANIVRPMLCFSVAQIQYYLKKNNIDFREDKSNLSTYYQRNNIRRALQSNDDDTRNQYLDEIENNKTQYAQLLEKCKFYSANYCTESNDGIFLSFDFLLDQDNKQEILYEFLKHYGSFPWSDVFSLLEGSVGKQVNNSEYRIVRERHGLYLSKIPSNSKEMVWINEDDKRINSPINLQLSVHSIKDFKLFKDHRLAVLDYDKLHFPLVLRPWQKGDSFSPLGMKGSKKISDFMIDEKFSTHQKENTWVICSLDIVVCIVGHRINDYFKLVPQTEKVYLVQPLKIEHGK